MFKSFGKSISIVALVGLAIGCGQVAPLEDTPENRLEQARALTALEVGSGALDAMLDEGAALAREATADMLVLELERAPTAEEMAEVEGVMRAGLAEYLTAELWAETVAQVYAENFTAAELQETVAFYASSAGRRILSLQRSLDTQVGDAIDAALDEHHDEFAARVDAALEERFPELGEGGS